MVRLTQGKEAFMEMHQCHAVPPGMACPYHDAGEAGCASFESGPQNADAESARKSHLGGSADDVEQSVPLVPDPSWIWSLAGTH
jgi:hypothetical protein